MACTVCNKLCATKLSKIFAGLCQTFTQTWGLAKRVLGLVQSPPPAPQESLDNAFQIWLVVVLQCGISLQAST